MAGYRCFHNLRVRFAELELTQQEVAKLSGVAVGTLSNRMTGRQPFRTTEITALAKVLKIDPADYASYFFETAPQRKGA